MKKLLIWCLGLSLSISAYAAEYALTDGDVVGQLQSITAKRGDTLGRLAVRHGVGYNEMVRANPKWRGRKIPSGTTLTLPTQHKLPSATRNGIVINLADMRLYYYPPGGGSVVTFPIAIGKRGWSTPRGQTSVIAKRKNPTWTPPASIRREAARRGRRLRRVYPAGPNNPLGTRALRLGISGYLIHGTNKPYSIGKRVSHGCIRLRRSDIESLFSMVAVHTPVTIVSEGSHQTYPSAPAGTSRSYQRQKNTAARKNYKKKRYNKKRHTAQRTRPVRQQPPARKRSRSYINSQGLDYRRLNNDIQNGNARPIDLSGI